MKTKRIISFIAALLLCAAMCTGAYALVSPSDEFYVTDSANVLSNETEQMIINYNGALEQQCSGAQIVVVTVDYLGGMYCDEYAYQLFNDWGVGSSEYNNGMLLLLAVQENKAWLAYGLGLNSLISSSDVDDMLDEYFWDDFDSGDYDEAVTALFKALLNWYDEHYDSSTASAGQVQSGTYSQPQDKNDGYYSSYGRSSSSLGGIIRVIVILLILSAIFGGGGRGRGGGSWLPWLLLFGIFGIALLRCAMIAFVEVSSFGIGTSTMYLATVHPLLVLYAFAGLLLYGRPRKTDKRRENA